MQAVGRRFDPDRLHHRNHRNNEAERLVNRELPGGGAWFVQRKVPGRDGSVLQGPPTRPLPKVELQQRGSDLVAIGMNPAGGA